MESEKAPLTMPSSEKSILPTTATTPNETLPPKRTIPKWLIRARIALLGFFALRYLVLPIWFPDVGIHSLFNHHGKHHHHGGKHATKEYCAQAEPLYPKSFDVSSVTAGEKEQIIQWLSDAVKIPTEIFDVMGPIGEDPRWDVFYKFSDYLENAFPLVHQHLKRTRVMTHALVYEWEGSDSTLKPLLLTGHQDVVPVLNATRGLWHHDPFGGEYDPETDRIWGRGSMDDKTGTVGSLAAVELLLKSGLFKPTRTVIMAYGIDEETGGKVGAYHLGKWIEERYGPDSIAMLVDEGNGLQSLWGQLYAVPAVAEKGYLDVEIRVETLGGHSSVPPAHTGIGFMSLLIAQMERHPHEPYLAPTNPLVSWLECAAEFSPEMPNQLKKSVYRLEDSMTGKHAKVDTRALKSLQDWFVEGSYEDGTLPKGMGKSMISTTQAVDIINGGVKVNALPEVVTAVVNHRISISSSPAELQKQLTHTLKPIAEKYNLALESFGKSVELKECPMTAGKPKAGKVILSEAFNSSLNVAPVSPYTVDAPAWSILSGTTKSVYLTRPAVKADEVEAKKDIVMAPSYSTGNTDTKRYWNLTKNIYRFAYLDLTTGLHGVHTVDEYIEADNFVEQVRWFATFIVNMDEARDI